MNRPVNVPRFLCSKAEETSKMSYPPRKPIPVLILIILAVSILFGCGRNTSQIIGSGTSEVVVCDFSKVRDTISVPLSSLVESCDMVILESRPEALIGNAWHTAITDDYIAVKSREAVPVRLFGIDGKYIRDIGAIGRGPDEYNSLYGIQFSPVGDMLYLLPFGTTDKINALVRHKMAVTSPCMIVNFINNNIIVLENGLAAIDRLGLRR